MLSRDLPCVLLAIDPGATSGWAHNGADAWTVGTASTWRERYAVVADAWQLEGQGRPLVVVAETWKVSGSEKSKQGKSKRWNSQTIAGLGTGWGLWLAELQRLDVPERRILRVDTGTWGQVVLGKSYMSTEQRHAASQMRARAVLGHDVGPDEAAALCIGLWGLRSETVAKAIGVRELKRLGWEGER
jgi:hypothetical protein